MTEERVFHCILVQEEKVEEWDKDLIDTELSVDCGAFQCVHLVHIHSPSCFPKKKCSRDSFLFACCSKDYKRWG